MRRKNVPEVERRSGFYLLPTNMREKDKKPVEVTWGFSLEELAHCVAWRRAGSHSGDLPMLSSQGQRS